MKSSGEKLVRLQEKYRQISHIAEHRKEMLDAANKEVTSLKQKVHFYKEKAERVIIHAGVHVICKDSSKEDIVEEL